MFEREREREMERDGRTDRAELPDEKYYCPQDYDWNASIGSEQVHFIMRKALGHWTKKQMAEAFEAWHVNAKDMHHRYSSVQ